MQLQQIQIQSPTASSLQGQATAQFISQQDHQQIQNQLIQQQIVLQQPNGTSGLQQISIQPKTQQPTSMHQTQALENRPLMSVVSISSPNVSSSNGSPILSSIASPTHITLQPQPNPLVAMSTLSYTASPSAFLKDEKQQNAIKAAAAAAAAASADEQQKLNDQMQQTAAAASLVSLSIGSSAAPTSAAVSSATNGATTTSSATMSVATSSTVSITPTVSMSTPKDKVPGKRQRVGALQSGTVLPFSVSADLVKTTAVSHGPAAHTTPSKTVSKPAASPRNEKASPTTTSSTVTLSSTLTTTTTAATKSSTGSAAVTMTVAEKDVKAEKNNNTPEPPIISSLNLIRNNKGLLPETVKPKVLTHVISGMIVHEGSEPFPITRKRYSDDSEEPTAKRQNTVTPEKPADPLTCAYCGKMEGKGKLRKKPYCSNACAKAAKSGSQDTAQQNGVDPKLKAKIDAIESVEASPPASLPSPSSSTSSTIVANGTTAPLTNGTAASNGCNGDAKKTSPTPNGNGSGVEANGEAEEQSYLVKWSVEDVAEYIRGLAGYSDYAEDFQMHEIDGQALILLNENHLVQTMNIKLGPALKIMSKIDAIKNAAPTPMEQ